MKKQLALYQQRVNDALTHFLTSHQTAPTELAEAIRYATLNNGKRLRPALVYATGEALGMSLDKLDAAACAIELVHSYSLVHDDLPAMDDDDLRRGVPTCHIKYGEATAILVGDAQQTLAFDCLANGTNLSDKHKVSMVQILSQASGTVGMIGGQFIDIHSEGKLPSLSALQKMHQMKTGALIQAALLLGACQSDRFDALRPNLAYFAEKIGLAFQIQDDILDIESNTETLGKPQGSDEDADKATYPKLIGLDASKNMRDTLISEAKECLTKMDIQSDFLISIAGYIADRNH
ncbi:(2E,6E)-farnesyl diphosphate synthase [Hydrogenovibrio marinus]|uniref:Geranyl transferase n=1 Tax=Hydrogenovibrio marinus TaxID=28885 RepID=A0A066ZNH4_HYDMR|nr:farnesyl diphosphate synthase [Hydrogenovibrio marinus]KDN95363.1 geranyl transferase [Hydrogenovibrio marinus]BBN59850.1 geranyltranstransferase [Hydrogenovibrio marinus]